VEEVGEHRPLMEEEVRQVEWELEVQGGQPEPWEEPLGELPEERELREVAELLHK